jgi:3',5'-cyclic-AMP phosphodiesterase
VLEWVDVELSEGEIMLLVAQLTDTHLFADGTKTMFDCVTNQTFAAVIQRLAQVQPRPDLLLLTGDISQDDTAASYEYARSLIGPLQIPTYWLRGNHDQNGAAIAQLNGDVISAEKSFEQGGWRFILLDSMVIDQPGGNLSQSQLQWLEQQLADNFDNAKPTLVAVHHHSIACGVEYMDAMALANADELFVVLDRYPQVKLVISGHIHQEFAAQRDGVTYLSAPSTCIQLKPNQAEIELDTDRMPGFRLLRLYPDGRFETEVCRLG